VTLFDSEGKVVSRDIPTVISRIKCSKEEPVAVLPKTHNQQVMLARKIFAEEVKHRQASQQYGLQLTVQQRYVLRELRALYGQVGDDVDLRGQITIIEKAFRLPMTTAVKKQVNVLRRNGVTGRNLLRTLTDIYHDYGMKDFELLQRTPHEVETENIPRIICSEALV
jgi:hypothetical protein